jgi:hypothetical protein
MRAGKSVIAGQPGLMAAANEIPRPLRDLLDSQDGVAQVGAVLRYLTRDAVRWRIRSGRWQQPCRGMVVAQSGPLTGTQLLWVAVVWGGPRAALAGLTAAALDGLRGFSDPDQRAERPIYLLRPAGALSSKERPGLAIAVHYSRHLGQDDVHPVRRPPRTRVARSLVDAAAWMGSDRGAQAVLAAGVQQRLVRVADLTAW